MQIRGVVAGNTAARASKHARCEIDRLVAHHGVFADRHAQCFEKHHYTTGHRLERASLLSDAVGRHFIGDLADELRRNLCAVLLLQRALSVANHYAPSVHGDDLVVDAC